jgi:hypothetical protein
LHNVEFLLFLYENSPFTGEKAIFVLSLREINLDLSL